MVPDARTVLRRRYAVLIGLRLLAVVIVAIGVVVLGVHLTRLTQSNIGFDMWEYRGAVMAAAGVFGVPAVSLALGSAWLSRWIVPGGARHFGCPGCGYTVPSVHHGVCPECGLNFGGGAGTDSAASPALVAKDHTA